MARHFRMMILLLIGLNATSIFAQNTKIQLGPMLGYCDLREVAVWIKLSGNARVKLQYYPVNNPDLKQTGPEQEAIAENDFIVTLVCRGLEPGTTYHYDILINNNIEKTDLPTRFKTQALWMWRGDPPDFNFATGSCAYVNETQYDRPGKPYGGDYRIFSSIEQKNPEFMLWLGDNTYYREVDWNARSAMIARNIHTRSIPEMRGLLAKTFNYAIWDDHDYGPNNSDRTYWNKNTSLDIFKLFWANPSYGIGDIKGAITFFQWYDADFYLLDNRFYRTPDYYQEENKTQLGQEQLNWLIESLVAKPWASFKFIAIGGQFLSDVGKYETYTAYGFEKERQYIIDMIYKYDIKNVVFLTGDRHQSELSVLKKEGEPTIYDLTISPFTSTPAKGGNDNNSLRVDGSLFLQRNFGILELTGSKKAKERQLIIHIYDTDGKSLWDYRIQSEF